MESPDIAEKPGLDARSRRGLLKLGLSAAGAMLVPSVLPAMSRRGPSRERAQALLDGVVTAPPVVPATPRLPSAVRPDLLRRALGALQGHGSAIPRRDRVAIADFGRSSATPRFHCVNLEDGQTTTLLVAHGSGSDPAHTGYLDRFSNAFDSNASCEGAFRTDGYYVGKHGRSQRLAGLDHSNCNAAGRAIVVHGAWYADPGMIAAHGKLGRSQGCFAVGEADLDRLFDHLGTGRMIYAAKLI